MTNPDAQGMLELADRIEELIRTEGYAKLYSINGPIVVAALRAASAPVQAEKEAEHQSEMNAWKCLGFQNEIDRLKRELAASASIQMNITNHHNALLCPHCNPKSLKFESFAPVQGAGEPMTHARNCGYFDDEIGCTCCLEERKALATEQAMHQAWRKRAEEAEAALAVQGAGEPTREQVGRIICCGE